MTVIHPVPLPDSERVLARLRAARQTLEDWLRYARAASFVATTGKETPFDDLAEALDAVVEHLSKEWPLNFVEIGGRLPTAADRKRFPGVAKMRAFAAVDDPDWNEVVGDLGDVAKEEMTT